MGMMGRIGIMKAAGIAANKTLANAASLKQKTIIYTKTKLLVTQEFMIYVATDPMFNGVAITVGTVAGLVNIALYGHQLFISSSDFLTDEQKKALIDEIATEEFEKLKVVIKNEIDEKFETWDINNKEKITVKDNQINSLTYQRNTAVVTLFAVVLFVAFGKTKGFEILAERIAE